VASAQAAERRQKKEIVQMETQSSVGGIQLQNPPISAVNIGASTARPFDDALKTATPVNESAAVKSTQFTNHKENAKVNRLSRNSNNAAIGFKPKELAKSVRQSLLYDVLY
jgi:hypothetical protein